MTQTEKEKRKAEWQKAVRPNIPDYYLSETLGSVYDFLQVPYLGVRHGAYDQPYSQPIADKIQDIRNGLKELRDIVIEEEQKDWASLTGKDNTFSK